MLFNSYIFIFVFLPITILLFFWTAKYSQKLALLVLFFSSLIFYCWNNYYFGIIFLGSIIVNFSISNYIIQVQNELFRKYLLIIGIFVNLGLLCYYKYVNFFVQNVNFITHSELACVNVIFPIGISFFTFTQIAYLVDGYRGFIKKYKFLNYALFVTYFPHLIAGPIIHHKEIMPQFEKKSTFKISSRNLLIGLTIFTIGLFKKVVLADYFVKLVVPVFDTHQSYLSTMDAWVGALAYTFELYFDFSGYSDMAVGLSFLFGIKLPFNFYSPYKAINIIEFWRRWNITLSRFLRDYLYIPLGGNRYGTFRKYLNIVITMLLGGLWHGANWTFIMWGGLHAVYLCINHGWIALKKTLGFSTNGYICSLLSRIITFIAVVVGWVFFRSPDFKTAFKILYAMFINFFILQSENMPNVIRFFSIPKIVFFIFISFFIIWILPNSYQYLLRFKPALITHDNCSSQKIIWRPSLFWTGFFSVVFVLGICFIQASSTFLYFQF